MRRAIVVPARPSARSCATHRSSSSTAASARGLRSAEPSPRLTASNVRLAASLSRRVKAPAECRDLAALTARYRADVDRGSALTAPSLLDLLLRVDALRRQGRFEQFLRACAFDWSSRSGRAAAAYPAAARLRAARDVVSGVDAAAIARAGTERSDLVRRLRRERLKTLRVWQSSVRPPRGAR